MIKESLERGSLPHSLELSTITLLPKPGKDRQKYGSYRPLSLLNVDYKVLTKLLALRLETVIPKLIHPDQTGFVKNRQGSDNIRRLLHIINIAQKQKLSMFILSMDAEKAFDRIEPTFLFAALEAMSFGSKFIGHLKTIFNSLKHRYVPMALYLTPLHCLGAVDKDALYRHYYLPWLLNLSLLR